MRALFVAPLGRSWPSSRMRCWQIADHWESADCIRWEGSLPETEHDVVVFHKLANPDVLEITKHLQALGKRVILDVCDPYWWWVEDYGKMINAVDLVVSSTSALAEDIRETFGVDAVAITDRFPYTARSKLHNGTREPILGWFGLSINRGPCLNSVGDTLKRLRFEGVSFKLRILDESPDIRYLPADWVEHRAWEIETHYDELLEFDVALLPTYPGPWGKMKSKNKWATAGWAGLPAVDGTEYHPLRRLLTDSDLRKAEGAKNRLSSEREYEISKSVDEWKVLCA